MNLSKRCNIILIILGLVLCGVSIFGTRKVLTDNGNTSVHAVKIVTESGYELAANIFVPKTATAQSPAPLVLVQHGGNNNKEEIELYLIELSRRGYVAVGVDMYSHGQSQPLPDSQWLSAGRGLYDALKYSLTLPYVDKDRVGLLGYSRGGKAASESLQLDNINGEVVKVVYLIHSDPIYRNASGYDDVYGARHVGLLADKHDEFFFSEKANDTGVYSNDANKYAQNLSSPVDFINNNSAQSFLHFGVDPSELDKRFAETRYTKEYSEGTGTRIINVSDETHMSGWYSTVVMNHVLTFFNEMMPASNPLPSTDYKYRTANVFSLIGVFGLLMFLLSVAVFGARYTNSFKQVDLGTPELRPANGKDKLWFWGLQVVALVVCVLLIMMLNKFGLSAYRNAFFRSANPLYHGLISLVCGTFVLVALALWYQLHGKKSGFDLKAAGLFPGCKVVFKSFVLALVSVVLMYLVIFATSYLFKTDYRFIFWGFQPFGANRIPGMIAVMPMYIVFYVAMSASFNCFNYSKAVGSNKWVNATLLSLLAAAPTLFIITYVYGMFKSTGWNPMFGGLASAATAVIALPAIVFVAVYCARIIYTKTGNLYLGGFINGIMTAVIAWTVCEIRVPDAGQVFPVNIKLVLILIISFAATIACICYFLKQRK